MIDVNKIILALQEYYIEKGNGADTSLDYDYGFMDAMSVFFNMVGASK